MKGILKGLKYISQMFDEKEPEMQIGLPTDVKHVAHIGWDGPSAQTPSWMNEFQPPEMSSQPFNAPGEMKSPITNLPSEDTKQTDQNVIEKPRHRPRRSTGSMDSNVDSPTKKSSETPKQSRRHRVTMESPTRESGSGGPRRQYNSNPGMESPGRDVSRPRRQYNSNSGLESPARDQPGIPRHSNRRKSKGSSRPKAHNTTDAGPTADRMSDAESVVSLNNESILSPVIEADEEERR